MGTTALVCVILTVVDTIVKTRKTRKTHDATVNTWWIRASIILCCRRATAVGMLIARGINDTPTFSEFARRRVLALTVQPLCLKA